jgi:hypothetical protein
MPELLEWNALTVLDLLDGLGDLIGAQGEAGVGSADRIFERPRLVPARQGADPFEDFLGFDHPLAVQFENRA